MNQIDLPKLEDMCVLVTIKSGKPQLTKKDRNATRAAEHEMNAQDGAGSYTKLLYPKPLIQPIVAAEQRVRNYVKSFCTVLDRNMWIAPKSFRQRIYEGGYELINGEYKLAVDAFLINYGQVLHAAQVQQGDMFDSSVYPNVSQVREQFRMDIKVWPMFRLNSLAVDEYGAMLEQQMETTLKNALADNMRDILGRMSEVVGSIASKLHTKLNEDGKHARFHDSLMENLDHLLEVVPELNFTKDPRIDTIVDEMRRKLRVPVEVLKGGTRTVQERILQDANDILKRMEGLV